jgi:hypothetical protein
MGNDLHGFGEPVLAGQLAKVTTRKPVEQPGKPAGLLGFQPIDACHDAPPWRPNPEKRQMARRYLRLMNAAGRT